MGPKIEKTTPRLRADAAFRKDFIEICLEEVNREGYCGNSMKQCSWSRLLDGLTKKYNTKYTQRQLKNQWDYLRKLYQAWRYLEKKSGNGYDAAMGTFHCPDHIWDDIVKNNPMTAQFRHSPLKHRDLLQSLFECTLDDADECFSQNHAPSRENPPNAVVLQEDDSFTSKDASQPVCDSQDAPQAVYNSTDVSYEDIPNTPASGQIEHNALPLRSIPPSQSSPSSHSALPSRSYASSSRAAGTRRKRAVFEDPLVKKFEEMMELIKGQHVSGVQTLDQAIELLNELLSLRLLDTDLYLASLKAFSDNPLYGKTFLKIESNELKVRFLTTIIG